MSKSKTIFYVSRLLYPKYHPIWLVIYMYFKYHSVIKRHIKYNLKTLSDGVLWNIVKNYPKSNCDINNCVLIHPDNIYPSDKILRLYHEDSGTSRKLQVIPETNCNKNTLYVSNTYFYNDFIMKIDFDLKLSKQGTKVEFAQEIELSLVSIPCDISNAIIDKIIENYFKLPKLICHKDIVSVNLKYFCQELFYGEPKLNLIENVYFKCNKLIYNNKEVDNEYLCLVGETSIRLGPNVQSFVPKVILMPTEMGSFSEVTVIPSGLEQEFEQLENAIYPFLSNKSLKLKPIFLVQGEEGCGDDVLIKALAKTEGMHHFRVNNSDLSANVYAQNESKLNNVFFTAKMAAPCILSIHKFEVLECSSFRPRGKPPSQNWCKQFLKGEFFSHNSSKFLQIPLNPCKFLQIPQKFL
ncbi:unnamed protein product [Ceutorhynchus assimilis]|uniref:ATPase AAA-type core domain-containing protein n=1 Tax=Ceutorhynchus assimilis TaxID=467358 RepID=A0A9N9QG46_9CUCU|nr:unnamed protein product [Ceutorhynchus assimilis]